LVRTNSKEGMAILRNLSVAILLLVGVDVASAARLKDIADIEGVRGNQLVGYGLVVGLNGRSCFLWY